MMDCRKEGSEEDLQRENVGEECSFSVSLERWIKKQWNG